MSDYLLYVENFIWTGPDSLHYKAPPEPKQPSYHAKNHMQIICPAWLDRYNSDVTKDQDPFQRPERPANEYLLGIYFCPQMEVGR